MTIASRIDSITKNANHTIDITFTTAFPLPPEATGGGTQFNSVQHMLETVQAAEERQASDAHLLALSKYLKADPLFLNPQAAVGHGVVIDMTGVAQVLQTF